MFDKLKNLLKITNVNQEPMQQDIVGIDVSHSYIRTIQLKKKNKEWSLVKFGSKVLDDVYESADKRNDAIVTHLKNLKLEQQYNFEAAAISLPVHSAIVQVVQIPYLEEDELKEAADNGSLWDSSINVPGELSEYSIFWQTVKKDREKNTLSILFVASRIEEVERNCDLIRRAGFDPVVVDIRCFALRNILKTYEETASDNTQLFVEISGPENYAVCMHEGLPFIYDIFVSDDDKDGLIKGGASLSNELFSRLSAQIRTAVKSFIKQSGVAGIEKIELSTSLPFADKIHQMIKKEIVEYKVELISPLTHVQVPAQLKSRIETEKNISSLAIAIGLATRQLDVFGYYKFVTAVSNINLLPNREDRIKKEKKKSTTTSLMKKISIISTLCLAGVTTLYAYMVVSLPSKSDITLVSEQAINTEASVTSQQKKLNNLKLWAHDSGRINNRILDISYTATFPRGSYVTEINQLRSKASLLTIRANDPSLASNIMSSMSKKYQNVMLLNIKAPTEKGKLNLLKISYEIK